MHTHTYAHTYNTHTHNTHTHVSLVHTRSTNQSTPDKNVSDKLPMTTATHTHHSQTHTTHMIAYNRTLDAALCQTMGSYNNKTIGVCLAVHPGTVARCRYIIQCKCQSMSGQVRAGANETSYLTLDRVRRIPYVFHRHYIYSVRRCRERSVSQYIHTVTEPYIE